MVPQTAKEGGVIMEAKITDLYNPEEAIREEWGHLSDMAVNLRKAINELHPRPSSEEEMNLLTLEDLADRIEELEKEFEGTLMEVAG